MDPGSVVINMVLDAQQAGIAILCDREATILRILRDDLNLTSTFEKGQSLFAIFSARSLERARQFWAEIFTHKAALDWELAIRHEKETHSLHFAGGRLEEHILVVGAISRSDAAASFYEDLMRVNNEQMNRLRAALKEQALYTQALKQREDEDQVFYDELTRLNNELVTVQRELAKKNAALDRYAEDLELLVAAKVRELEKERAKTIHTAKMAALGELATGVAHELNQPLTAMIFEIDYLKALTEALPPNQQDSSPENPCGDIYQVAENLTEDVARCRRITDHLRSFGRISEGEVSHVDLNQIIESSFILVGQRLHHHSVTSTLQLDPELPLIMANPHKLEQVLLNLIGNAEYALEKMDGRIESGQVERPGYQKQLEITTYVSPDPDQGANADEQAEKPTDESSAVVAVVRDNGCGIPEAEQEHLFEPFFTTKPDGEGTGLGLSISHDIVTEVGGQIACQSTENQGTTFTLRFPIAPDTEDEA